MAATESHVDYFLQPHCGEGRGRVRNSEIAVHTYSPSSQMPPLTEPHMQFYPRDDKHHIAEMRAQYHHSWSTPPPYSVPPHGYPSNEVSGNMPPMYSDMRMQMTPYMTGAATPMANPMQPTSFGASGQQPTPRSRGRVDFGTDSSSSNCTPRDHYGVIEKSQNKRHSRKAGSPRLPVVKIPESLKKHGQPSPATCLNSRGFPVRLGKADCKHYISKGWCAYGTLCKFNHPDSITMVPMPCPTMASYGPHSQGMNPPWMGMSPYGWAPWTQQQMYPMPQGACYPPCAGGYSCTVSSPTASMHSSQENSSNDNEKANYSEVGAMMYN
eukprot:g3278.t1